MKIKLLFFFIGLAQIPLAQTITLENKTDRERIDEPFVIQQNALKVPAGKFPVFKDLKGNIISSQVDDLNGDSQWDEAAFVYSLKPKESVKLKVEYTDKLPGFKRRTYARLGKRNAETGRFETVTKEVHPKEHMAQSEPWLYQFEGPGWENDKVAFRAYFDSRNGKDIYGKITSRMVLDSIQLFGNYHEFDARWGMDVLKVGKSLGAGALAFQKNHKLIRFSNIDDMQYTLVSTGPVRSIIRLIYKNWKLDEKNIDLVEQIIIWAGKYGYEREITWNTNDTLLCGLVTLHNDKDPIYDIQNRGFKSLATHSAQSENHDILGMGIMVPAQNFAGYGKAPDKGEGDEITQTVFVKIVPSKENKSATFQFFAAWEKSDPRFADQKYFKEYLQIQADHLNLPVKMTIGK